MVVGNKSPRHSGHSPFIKGVYFSIRASGVVMVLLDKGGEPLAVEDLSHFFIFYKIHFPRFIRPSFYFFKSIFKDGEKSITLIFFFDFCEINIIS
ncbi:hypothetical protein KKH82_05075, partial [Patescibacteria group bacterium]|nr:hypothetical protein [Patescibacteria group bacterium]